jgi:DNA-binding NarL/FixJ family response regulator
MRVLLIEDHTHLAGPVSRELEAEFGCTVKHARDPIEAAGMYRQGEFDLAVVDLLYQHLHEDFQARLAAGKVTLTSAQLLITGLAAVHHLTASGGDTGIVIWTSGEANRRLHLLFAYEDLGVRVFCSKSSGTGRIDNLLEALRAAAAGRSYVDPVLNSYLPAPGTPKISETILRGDSKRAIWRAIALGAHTRERVSEITGYRSRTVGNLTPQMYTDLTLLDPGLGDSKVPLTDLVSYASKNWEFLLDDTVRARYP